MTWAVALIGIATVAGIVTCAFTNHADATGWVLAAGITFGILLGILLA